MLRKIIDRIGKECLPIYMLSTIILILGLVNHLYNPIRHFENMQFTFEEMIVRSLFIFCSLFGFFHSGRNIKIVSLILSLPFLYLGVLYTATYIFYAQVYTLIVPATIFLTIGFWISIHGVIREYRAHHINNRSYNSTLSGRFCNRCYCSVKCSNRIYPAV